MCLQAPSITERIRRASTPTGECLWVWDLFAEREKPLYPVHPGQTLTLAHSLPSITCSPRRAWWMVRLRLLCILNRMTLPVWLNLGAPATYTRPCLEDTTDVTVYPVEGGNRLVSGARCSVGLAGFCHGAQSGLRRSIEFRFSCACGLIKESGDLAQWRACGWLMQTEPCT